MKRFLIVILIMCFGIFLVGCGEESKQPASGQITFSNLVETSIQDEVSALMDGAGVSDARQAVFFEHVNQFNNVVPAKSLTKGYESAGILDTKYDPYDMQDQWMSEYPYFLGYNCRITAYGLFGDFIDIPLGKEIRDNFILMDLSSLEEDPSAMEVVDGDLERFKILYSAVPTEGTKDIEVHVTKVREAWEKKGIKFKSNEKASLITVWIHDQLDGDNLFVGHAGVLFEEEDTLYFVEKLAFQEPYQVVKFNDRTELSDYMMTKYDFSEGQPTAAPFIMENDQLMEGYRKIEH